MTLGKKDRKKDAAKTVAGKKRPEPILNNS